MFSNSLERIRRAWNRDQHETKHCPSCVELVGDCLSYFDRDGASKPALKEQPNWLTEGCVPGFGHRKSLADVKSSADAGCDVCALIYQEAVRCDGIDPTRRVRLWYAPRLDYYNQDDGRFATKPEAEIRIYQDNDVLGPDPVLQFSRDESIGNQKSPRNTVTLYEQMAFARRIVPDPRAETCAENAISWLTTCSNQHPLCADAERMMQKHALLPTRILDVTPNTARDGIRLRERADMASIEQHSSYIALSHCWGGKLAMTTTRETLSTRLDFIPLEQLPKTFADAVTVTRALGIRYLWIDALCIIQGDEEDWTREAGLMAKVYAQATVTISALDSPNGASGILNPREKFEVRVPFGHSLESSAQTSTFLSLRPRSIRETLRHSILNERAWVLQERILSPRILHYASDQMIWECKTLCSSESGESFSTHAFLKLGAEDTDFKHTPGVAGSATQPYEMWRYLIEDFSRRSLSFRSDKLAAVAGLADLFSPICMGYVNGLWTGDLVESLMWNTGSGSSDPGFADKTYLPSYSWACVTGRIYYDNPSFGLVPTCRIHTAFDLEMDPSQDQGGHHAAVNAIGSSGKHLSVIGTLCRTSMSATKGFHSLNDSRPRETNERKPLAASLQPGWDSVKYHFDRSSSEDVWLAFLTSYRNERDPIFEGEDAGYVNCYLMLERLTGGPFVGDESLEFPCLRIGLLRLYAKGGEPVSFFREDERRAFNIF